MAALDDAVFDRGRRYVLVFVQVDTVEGIGDATGRDNHRSGIGALMRSLTYGESSPIRWVARTKTAHRGCVGDLGGSGAGLS
ncbi:hypothetical protein [Rhodococcus sp. NPDC058639]|uniref:hypothetical protein n=1 Tax=Rhodococcus sp. NPDC058639 TaxID=3346570 RepID=UPI003668547E